MTIIPFTPNNQTAFQFQATLDRTLYTGTVRWSLYGQRYYLNLTTLQGAQVANVALIGSPNDYDIDLVGGYFTTSSIVFREASQVFEVTP